MSKRSQTFSYSGGLGDDITGSGLRATVGAIITQFEALESEGWDFDWAGIDISVEEDDYRTFAEKPSNRLTFTMRGRK